MLSRRYLLKQSIVGSTLISLSRAVPTFLARSAQAATDPSGDDSILVVLQLDGGNDGINTVVPFGDEGYAQCRRALRIPTDKLLKLNDHVGLHPAMRGLADLWQAGRLAVVQGVGYPNPNRSHFQSMAIWHTARLNPDEAGEVGWIGRGLDGARPVSNGPALMHVGHQTLPLALRSRRSVASSIARPEQYQLANPDSGVVPRGSLPTGASADLLQFVTRNAIDATATAAQLRECGHEDARNEQYPDTGLAGRLRLIARLIRAGLGTRIYYTLQSGYDTHAGQPAQHDMLLREFAGALNAFMTDMERAGVADRVAVMAFSEFGRRAKENISEGTDHGTAGPVFVVGAKVKGGLIGATPSLCDLEEGDLKASIDFRQVYATVLDHWLSVPSKLPLGGEFGHLRLFAATGASTG